MLFLLTSALIQGKIDNSTADCGNGVTCYPCASSMSDLRTAPNCSALLDVCFSDHQGKIKSFKTATPAECCAACSNHSECQSFTHFDQTNCNLFSDASPTISKPGCVSGAVGPFKPTPPPTPLPPTPPPTPLLPTLPPTPAPPTPVPTPVPPPGPACKDCPNILLMFTG